MYDMSDSNKKWASAIRNEEEINKGNRIILVHNGGEEEEVSSLYGVHIVYSGNNSLIRIHEGYQVKKASFYIGEGGYLEIGRFFRVRFSLTIDLRAKNTTIKFGNFVNIGQGQIYAGDEENLEIIVGDDFLAATELFIRNADGHTIYDINNQQPINQPQFGIHIGNHVWCGYDVKILKDANIPSNCIVGSGALVGKGTFCENSIIAGVPARMIRTEVNWDSKAIGKFVGERNVN